VADKTTGIHDLGQGKTIGIYDANGNVNVKFTNFKGETATVSIFNLLGQNIAIANVAAIGTQTINSGDLASGYYIVKVELANTSVSSKLVLSRK
ncbi:MAG: T9SS type A sorting domain-containing protein, partial [Bacteroidetes bacterium]|nr:T9SS type A sorting domain-containing protein [Bacteroidota bacterium]